MMRILAVLSSQSTIKTNHVTSMLAQKVVENVLVAIKKILLPSLPKRRNPARNPACAFFILRLVFNAYQQSQLRGTIQINSFSAKQIGPIYFKNQLILKTPGSFVIYIKFTFVCHQARFSSSYCYEMTAKRIILLMENGVLCFVGKSVAI